MLVFPLFIHSTVDNMPRSNCSLKVQYNLSVLVTQNQYDLEYDKGKRSNAKYKVCIDESGQCEWDIKGVDFLDNEVFEILAEITKLMFVEENDLNKYLHKAKENDFFVNDKDNEIVTLQKKTKSGNVIYMLIDKKKRVFIGGNVSDANQSLVSKLIFKYEQKEGFNAISKIFINHYDEKSDSIDSFSKIAIKKILLKNQ